jgi:Kef-type K+ transport system membrane component KefB
MVMVNIFHRASRRISDVLQSFVPPFYIIFFVLAGAHLRINLLLKLGVLGIIYIICRTSGLMGGAWLGAVAGHQPPNIRRYLGLGILSQAGVAVGLAYLVIREFAPLGIAGQHIATLCITIIAATTIVFEIIGPIAVKFAITRAGEVRGEK